MQRQLEQVKIDGKWTENYRIGCFHRIKCRIEIDVCLWWGYKTCKVSKCE